MKLAILTTAFYLLPTLVSAETNTIRATVTDVQPMYEHHYVDYVTQVCGTYYKEDHSLEGAIIGGVIGNQFGEGDGKTAMTVLGAIIGADQGKGGRKTQCYDEINSRVENVFVGYNVKWKWVHSTGQFQTMEYFDVGQRIWIEYN
jgi:uncharacterized protein YcfJ